MYGASDIPVSNEILSEHVLCFWFSMLSLNKICILHKLMYFFRILISLRVIELKSSRCLLYSINISSSKWTIKITLLIFCSHYHCHIFQFIHMLPTCLHAYHYPYHCTGCLAIKLLTYDLTRIHLWTHHH